MSCVETVMLSKTHAEKDSMLSMMPQRMILLVLSMDCLKMFADSSWL
jgi:hypothetical protein